MTGATVIKIGGELVAAERLPEIWAGIGRMMPGEPVVLVHGGGGTATRLAERLGHRPRIVQGRRVTTDTDLDIVLWTMRGEVNTRLVAAGYAAGHRPVGLCGADAGLVQVDRRLPWRIEGEDVDFGWVGDVRRVDTTVLSVLLAAGYLPVVGPVGIDEVGHLYNVNADTVAGALAVALGARRLLLVTATGALRRAADGSGDAVPECDPALYARGLDEGWIGGGMQVKLHVALEAARAGIGEVRVVGPGDLGKAGTGTRVRADA